MKKLIFAVLVGLTASAQPYISMYRYGNIGPQRMFAGYSYIWYVQPALAFDATCDSTLNNCYSAQYTPAANDVFVPDPDQTMPGGVQNLNLEFSPPKYKAVNIGTSGNAAGHWNIMQALANNGATAQQVTITSTATVRFYLSGGYWHDVQMHYPVGWPTGTSFTYWSATTVGGTCLSGTATANPGGYLNFSVYSSGYVRCAEISIPATATPGTFNAGWEFCQDTSGTGCVQLLKTITLEAPPTMERTPPATIPALPSIYNQATLAMTDLVNGTTKAGTDVSFTNVAGAASNSAAAIAVQGAGNWCRDWVNPDSTLESAGYYLAFSDTGGAAQATGLGWYYDGVKHFYQAAKWFNEPRWENCARAVQARYTQRGPGASGYRAGILAGSGVVDLNGVNTGTAITGRYPGEGTMTGGNNGYYAALHSAAQLNNSFPKGVELGLSRFNGGNYSSTWVPSSWQPGMKNELYNMIANNGSSMAVGQKAGYGSMVDIRSPGYAFDQYLALVASGDRVRSSDGTLTGLGWHRQKMADAIASMLLIQAQPAAVGSLDLGPVGTQTWMIMGPEIESAIAYWEQTHEPRMAKAILYVLDRIGSQYSWTQHASPFNNSPQGPYCTGTGQADAATKWYAGTIVTGNCMTPMYAEMNGMAAYAFAWAWKNWGNDSYRALADEMFTYSLIGDISCGPCYRYRPKPYYQNGKYWYLYLQYRLGN